MLTESIKASISFSTIIGCATIARMRMKFLLFAALLLFTPILGIAQSSGPNASFSVSPETRDAVRQIIGESILNGKAYAYDGDLADMIGPRLTGSSNYMRAVEWTEQQLKALGLTN